MSLKQWNPDSDEGRQWKITRVKMSPSPLKCCSQATMKKWTGKRKRWMIERRAQHPTLVSQEKARQKDWQTSREHRPSCFCLVPLTPFLLRLKKAIVWHLVPVSLGCYKPAVKCNAFCHACAFRLLLLFGCGGIRAGTRGSTVHPKESRFHIPEWNAFWHCSASPWFE